MTRAARHVDARFRRLRAALLFAVLALLLFVHHASSRSDDGVLSGLWIGTLSAPDGTSHSVLLMVGHDRSWLLLPVIASQPALLASGHLEAPGEHEARATGVAFDGPGLPADYSWTATRVSPTRLEGQYRRLLHDSRLERGELRLQRHGDEERLPISALAGAYAGADFDVQIDRDGNLRASAAQGSAMGACAAIHGRALAAERGGTYLIQIVLDTGLDPGCRTGSVNPIEDHFRGGARLHYSADCPGEPGRRNSLSLTLVNPAMAYHLPDLCRQS